MGSGAGEASLQEARTCGAALLRMELHSGEVPVLDNRGEPFARCDGCRRLGDVRVREPVRLLADVRPADARDAPFREAYGAAGRDADSLDAAVLLARLEGKLQAEADAQRRLRARLEHVDEPARAQALHRGARGP